MFCSVWFYNGQYVEISNRYHTPSNQQKHPNVDSNMRSLSSQDDGGGPGSSWSFLSQDFVEQTTSLDRPDTVCGDVSGDQYFCTIQ